MFNIKHLSLAVIFCFGALQASGEGDSVLRDAESHEAEEIAKMNNEIEKYLSIEERITAAVQDALIEFSVAHYYTAQELEKTYIHDTVKGDIQVEAMLDAFSQSGILNDVVRTIIEIKKEEDVDSLSAMNEEELFPVIKQNIIKVMLASMKRQFFFASTVYNRVHAQ